MPDETVDGTGRPGGATATLARPAPRPDSPPAAAPPAPPRGSRSPGGHGAPAATLALTVLTLAAAGGYARVFVDNQWIGPVMLTAVVAHVVAWATRTLRLLPVSAALVDLAAVVLLAVWTVVPASTTYGLPLGRSWRAVDDALTTVDRQFTSTVSPVPVTHGWLLLAVGGAGVVAVLADGLAFRTRSPFRAAIPALALCVTCGVLGTSRGRTWAVALVVGATVAAWAVHRATVERAGTVWFGNRSHGVAAWTAVLGTVSAALAVLAVLLATPLLPVANGHGLLGWKGDGPGSGTSNREVPSPIVDLQTRLLTESAVPVFTVTSDVASYWRLTSLDDFNGVQWQSTDSYTGVHHQLPGTQPPAPGAETVHETFHIQQLSSIWMPTAFFPESISGGGQVSWDRVSDSLLAARSTSNGLTYKLTSVRDLSSITAAQLASAPAPARTAATVQDLELPASVPTSVRRLALQITASAKTEYQKALALQNYFIDDPDFTYSLQPPSDGYGTAALTTFLFSTQTGYCQQFAGAFAVLAREVGLPTRLAVGFTTGQEVAPNEYQVRDADAHTWPEVWFGPAIGWLPFEPTKGGAFAIPGASGYTGNTARVVPQTTSPTTAPTPTGTAPLPNRSPARLQPHLSSPATVAPAATPTHRSGAPLVAAAAAVAALVAWLAVNGLGRRLRWQRRRRRAGAQRILVAWAEVCELLAWWGCRRRGDETLREFALRAGHHLRGVFGNDIGLRQLLALADAAGVATYADGEPSVERVHAAVDAEAEVQRLLEYAAPRRRRMARWLDPRLAWRPAPTDPAPALAAPARLFTDPA